MITNNGIELISKYLAGQAGSYASYIAIGCGARPLSNEQPILVSATGTLGVGTLGVDGYVATLSLGVDAAYLEVGDVITASNGTGGFGSGTVTVYSIVSRTQIEVVKSTAFSGAGSVTNIYVVGSLRSKNLSSKTRLDFEMARFPITSRSYVVDKQVSKCSSMFISGTTEITVVTVLEHPFVVGDTVYISDVDYQFTGPTTDTQVNGLYVISSVTSSGFLATQSDDTLGNWDSSLWGTGSPSPTNNYTGFSYNSLQFKATVYTKQISLTAELSEIPSYDITELGIYSLGSDQYSTTSNSRMLINFTQNEDWSYVDAGESLDLSYNSSMVLPLGSVPFFASSSDSFWTEDYLTNLRQEKPRILSDALVVPGTLSDWVSTGTFDSTSDYLSLPNPGVDFTTAKSTDEVSLAFSIANAIDPISAVVTQYHIMLQFMSSNGNDSAKLMFDRTGGNSIPANRYVVHTQTIADIVKTSGFVWSDVSSVRVYVSVQTSALVPTADYAIVLDGLRLESSTTNNPLYALTAYTIVNNDTATKILKRANSKDLINFKLDLAIGQ